MRLLVYLFFFLSPPAGAQNLTDMLAQNPLLASMSMFSDVSSENATISLPPDDDDSDDVPTEELIQKLSTKRSSSRETVSDNFDHRYFEMNRTLFAAADPESGDLDYREFAASATSPDDVALQNAIQTEDDDVDDFRSGVTTSMTSMTSSSPFAASNSLFETPIATTSSDLARSSPYFHAFPTTSSESLTSSESSTSSEPPEVEPDPFEPPSTSTTDVDEQRFFQDAGSRETSEVVDDDGDDDDTENNVEDISTSPEDSDDVTTTPMTSGMPMATFQGSSYMKLGPVPTEVMHEMMVEQRQPSRRDEHEVVQYNGQYSVSATKYYIDNRVEGEHYQPAGSAEHSEQIDDSVQENTLEDVQDAFAVEREMRKVARMHAAKTQSIRDPLADLEMMMEKDRERRADDEIPEKQTVSKRIDTNGKSFETRETVYKGRKTTVNLWNANLYGHDLMRYPGAIFDDRIDEPRRKSDKRRAVASRIVPTIRRNGGRGFARPRHVVAGVTTNWSGVNEKERKTTEDVESVCFNTKQNTAIVRISPFDTEEKLTKLECLTKCAKSDECAAVTFSVPLATCAMYRTILELQNVAIRSQGHSLHRKLSRTTLRCVRMFVSKDVFTGDSEDPEIQNPTPPFLRLVEKDDLPAVSLSLLFAQTPRCPETQDVIFVRSDDVEAASHPERRDYIEISEDDCVFACLTNTRPGGGTADCTAIEYDKTRGFCFLMTSAPGEAAMTPRPVHPVTTYEKICIQQSSANKCSGGQPIRHRQKVLIGHLVDAHSVGSAAECVDLCIEKHTIGCVSVMFYAKESTLNCILNDATNLEDPGSFFVETTTIVDFFSIEDCLGIREVNRRAKKRLFQNRAEQLARLRRKMARL